MLSMHIQLITILQEMASLLGGVSGGFGDYGVVCYDFMSELIADIYGCVLIDTDVVVLVSLVGFFLGSTVESVINFFLRTGIGLMYWISCVF